MKRTDLASWGREGSGTGGLTSLQTGRGPSAVSSGPGLKPWCLLVPSGESPVKYWIGLGGWSETHLGAPTLLPPGPCKNLQRARPSLGRGAMANRSPERLTGRPNDGQILGREGHKAPGRSKNSFSNLLTADSSSFFPFKKRFIFRHSKLPQQGLPGACKALCGPAPPGSPAWLQLSSCCISLTTGLLHTHSLVGTLSLLCLLSCFLFFRSQANPEFLR